jgi:hypothetical protein
MRSRAHARGLTLRPATRPPGGVNGWHETAGGRARAYRLSSWAHTRLEPRHRAGSWIKQVGDCGRTSSAAAAVRLPLGRSADEVEPSTTTVRS